MTTSLPEVKEKNPNHSQQFQSKFSSAETAAYFFSNSSSNNKNTSPLSPAAATTSPFSTMVIDGATAAGAASSKLKTEFNGDHQETAPREGCDNSKSDDIGAGVEEEESAQNKDEKSKAEKIESNIRLPMISSEKSPLGRENINNGATTATKLDLFHNGNHHHHHLLHHHLSATDPSLPNLNNSSNNHENTQTTSSSDPPLTVIDFSSSPTNGKIKHAFAPLLPSTGATDCIGSDDDDDEEEDSPHTKKLADTLLEHCMKEEIDQNLFSFLNGIVSEVCAARLLKRSLQMKQNPQAPKSGVTKDDLGFVRSIAQWKYIYLPL